jgi:hypothetical protein
MWWLMMLGTGKYASYVVEHETRVDGWEAIGTEYQGAAENMSKDRGWNCRVIEKGGIFWGLFQGFALLRETWRD